MPKPVYIQLLHDASRHPFVPQLTHNRGIKGIVAKELQIEAEHRARLRAVTSKKLSFNIQVQLFYISLFILILLVLWGLGPPEPRCGTAAALVPGAARTAMSHRRSLGTWGRPNRNGPLPPPPWSLEPSAESPCKSNTI